jgi:hypothetical protein
MSRYPMLSLMLASCASSLRTDQPAERIRSITEADSVLAIYHEDHGLRPGAGGTAIILVAWPDGQVVWSRDRLNGGGPYRVGHIDPKKVANLLDQFEKTGLFADEKLNQARFGPDSQFITLHIKSGTRQVKMRSWHELYEVSDKVVARPGLVHIARGQRLAELRKAPADYLFFRMVWSETRSKLSELIPEESRQTTGEPIMRAGVLTWREPAAAP